MKNWNVRKTVVAREDMPEEHRLRQSLGWPHLVALGVGAIGQKTAIGAGKYITRKLYVEVVTDGAGYSATQVEYQMTRWLSVLSTVSTIGRSSATVRVSKDY
jgi:translocation and assembly module TamB